MNSFDVIKAPVISEKAFEQRENGTYVFWVDLGADKTEVKSAVEQAFGVKVTRINMMNVPGKRKRMGRFLGQRVNRKKAFVQLAEGQTIELVEELG